MNNKYKFDFNVNDYKHEFEPVTPGLYKARITDIQVKQAKNNADHDMLVITYTLEQNKRRIIERITIAHPDEQIQSYGRQRLNWLRSVTNLEKLLSPEDLLAKDLMLKVDIEENSYGAQNRVKGYKKLDTFAIPVSSMNKTLDSKQSLLQRDGIIDRSNYINKDKNFVDDDLSNIKF